MGSVYDGRIDSAALYPLDQAQLLRYAAAGQNSYEVVGVFYSVTRANWKEASNWLKLNRKTVTAPEMAKAHWATETNAGTLDNTVYNLASVLGVDAKSPFSEGILLIYVPAGMVTGFTTIEKNCATIVEMQQFWDQAVIPTLPDNGQGFWYRIRIASYDKTTGLYTGYIEKVTILDQTSTDMANVGDYNSVTYEHTSTNAQATSANYVGAGKQVFVDNEPTEACTFKNKVEVRTAIDRNAHSYTNTAAYVANSVVSTQNAADATPIVAGDGQTVVDQSQPTDYPERWRRVVEVRTAIDQLGAEEQNSHSEIVVRDTNTQTSNSDTNVSSAVGYINAVSVDPTDFVNRFRRTTTVRKAIDQDANANVIAGAYVENVATSTHVTAQAGITQSDGAIVSVEHAPTEFGTFRQSIKSRTSIDQLGAEVTNSHAEDVARSVNTQTSNNDTTVASSNGWVNSVSVDPTEYVNRFRRVVTNRQTKDQPILAYDIRHDQSATVDRHTQNVSAAGQPSPPAGQIARVEQRWTEFGRVASDVVVTNAIDQPINSAEIRHDQTSNTTAHTQGEVAAVPAVGQGTIARVEQRYTEFGKVASAVVVTNANSQSALGAVVSGAYVENSQVVTHATAQAVPTSTAGSVVSAEHQPTEFGTYRQVQKTRTAIDQKGSEVTAGHAEALVRDINTATADSSSAISSGAGYINSVDIKPTEYVERFNRVVTSRKAIDQPINSIELRHDQTASTNAHTQGDPIATPALAQGMVARVEQRYTEFGKVASALVVTNANAQVGFTNVVAGAYSENAVLTTHATAQAGVSSSDGVINSVDHNPTEFGTWRQVARARTAIDQSGAESENSFAAVTRVSINTQSDNATVAPLRTVGTITSESANPTEYPNRWARRVVVREILNQNATSRTNTAAYDEAVYANTSVAEGALGAVSDGTLEILTHRPTPEGRFAQERTVRTAKDQLGTALTETNNKTVSVVTHTATARDTSTPVSTFGYVNSLENAPTEYANVFRVQNTIQVRKLQDSGWVIYDDILKGIVGMRSIEGAPLSYITGVISGLSNANTHDIAPLRADDFGTFSTVITSQTTVAPRVGKTEFYPEYATFKAGYVLETEKIGNLRYYRQLPVEFREAADTNINVVMNYIYQGDGMVLSHSVTTNDKGFYAKGDSVFVTNANYGSTTWQKDGGWPVL
jgi:hypothetical protein